MEENSNKKSFQSPHRQNRVRFNGSSKLARVPKLVGSLVKKFFGIAYISQSHGKFDEGKVFKFEEVLFELRYKVLK